MNKYSTEARERWGDTSAYREHEEKTKHYTKGKRNYPFVKRILP